MATRIVHSLINVRFLPFVFLNFLDASLTSYIISKNGFDAEANTLIHWLLTTFNSTLILWLWKLIMLSLVMFVSVLTDGNQYEKRWKRIMTCANVMMVLVVLWGTYIAYEST